jgi:hypothetical protein
MPIARSVEEGRDQVAALVERFGRNLAHYRRPEYKEAQRSSPPTARSTRWCTSCMA